MRLAGLCLPAGVEERDGVSEKPQTRNTFMNGYLALAAAWFVFANFSNLMAVDAIRNRMGFWVVIWLLWSAVGFAIFGVMLSKGL
jgi:NhaP-type Na+/H+ or K+/H+ antiporter